MLRRLLLTNFRTVYRFNRWLRRHFTATGYLVLCSMGVSLVVGMNTSLNLASQIFTFLLIILLVSLISSWFFRPTLQVQRRVPPYATVMEPVGYTLQLSNPTGKSYRGLQLIEELQLTWPSYEELCHYQDPTDQYRNPFDRYVGFPKWVSLVNHKQGAEVKPSDIPYLAPGEILDVPVRLIPKRRGYLQLQGYRLVRPDLFGLVNGIKRFQEPGSLLVLPRCFPVAKLDLPGTPVYQPGGVPSAGSCGETEEFAALRDYRQGDSLRSIHWKSWARSGKPIVKEYRSEYFTRHALILDTFALTAQETVFEAAVSVAASLVSSVDLNENLLDLMFIGPEVYRFTAGRGLHNPTQLLTILACVQMIHQQPFSRLHQAVLEYAGQFSSSIAVLLDWDSPRQQLVRQLRSRGVPTLALVVSNGALGSTLAGEAMEIPTHQLAEKLQQL
jgi:uncharacterized protein (DUF58 family)